MTQTPDKIPYNLTGVINEGAKAWGDLVVHQGVHGGDSDGPTTIAELINGVDGPPPVPAPVERNIDMWPTPEEVAHDIYVDRQVFLSGGLQPNQIVAYLDTIAEFLGHEGAPGDVRDLLLQRQGQLTGFLAVEAARGEE